MKKYDDDLEFGSLNEDSRDSRFIVPIIIVAVLLAIVIAALVLIGKNGKNKDTSADPMATEQSETTEAEAQTTEVMGTIEATESAEEADADDPQGSNMGNETGASVDVTALLSAGSVAESGQISGNYRLESGGGFRGTVCHDTCWIPHAEDWRDRCGFQCKIQHAGSAGKRDKNRGILLVNSSDGRRSCTGSGLGGRLYVPVSDHLSGCI